MAVNTSLGSARQFMPYFVVTGALSMGYGSVFTLLAKFREKFGFSETELGFITAVGFFAGVLAQIGLSRFADKGHVALLVHCGVIVAIVSMLGMTVADQAWQFTAARFFLGAGTGATGPAIRRILITRDPANMGQNLGTMGAFDIFGFVLGPVAAGELAESFNLQAPFIFMAVLYTFIYLWVFRLDLTVSEVATTKTRIWELFRIRSLRSGLLAGAAFFTTIGVFETSWAVLLDDLGAGTRLIYFSISLFAVPMIPLAPFGGRVAHRRGPMRVMPVSIMGAVACMFVYGFVDFVWVLIAVSAAHAMFDAFTMPAGQLAVALSAPSEQAAAAQGLYGALGLVIAGLAALATGSVYDAWGPEILFVGSSVVMVIALAGAVALGSELMGPPRNPPSESVTTGS